MAGAASARKRTLPPDSFPSAGARRWFLAVLLAASALNYTDRVIFVMLVEPIKLDLKVSDFQIGLAGGITFAVFQTLLGIPLARLAERRSRVRIIAICTGFWSLMASACGMVGNFSQFVLCRIGVGIGEAGFMPAATSLVGDRFREDRRGGAMAVIQLGSPLSALIAALLTVFVASSFGWRVAFIVAGLPGLIVMVLLWRLQEPARGQSESVAVSTDVPSFATVVRTLLAKPSFRCVMLGAMLVTIGMNGISQFLVPFYTRSFALGTGEAATLYAVLNATAIGVALLVGGYGMDWAGRLDRKWHALIPAIGVAISAVSYCIAFTRESIVPAGAFVMLGALTQFLFFVPTVTMVQNMVGPMMRASAIAIASVVMGLIGGGVGPSLTGLLSDRLASRAHVAGDFALSCPGGNPAPGATQAIVAACAEASATGLRQAFLILCAFFAAGAISYFAAARHVGRDAFSATGDQP